MSKTCIGALAFLIMIVAAANPVMGASSRRVKPGDITPEFSVLDLSGNTYAYSRESKKALVVLFLSAKQGSSFKAQTDLVRILSQLSDSSKGLDIVIALNDPNAFTDLTDLKKQLKGEMVVTLDREHHLWGRFGAIAMPTVVIANAQGRVVRFEAGYGYNFAPVIRSSLAETLGAPSDLTQASDDRVETVSNATPKAKMGRLINAANMMAAKGHFDAAIVEIKKVLALDPNAIEIQLALAELYCKTSQGNEAIKLLQHTKGNTRVQKAQIYFIIGWSHRLAGHPDEAIRALTQATELAPEEPKAFYELGRIYEKKGLRDKALAAYRHALDLLF
jgi:tetratricopeptide (TPR) repeat protein